MSTIDIKLEKTLHIFQFVSMARATVDDIIGRYCGHPVLPSAFSNYVDPEDPYIFRIVFSDYEGNLHAAYSPESSPFVKFLVNQKPNARFSVIGWRKYMTDGVNCEVIESSIAYFSLDLQYVHMVQEAGKSPPGALERWSDSSR